MEYKRIGCKFHVGMGQAGTLRIQKKGAIEEAAPGDFNDQSTPPTTLLFC